MGSEEKKRLQLMLKRIAGQVNGIGKMIEEDKGCEATMTQIVAAMNSLRSVGRSVMADASSSCSKEEFEKILKRYL